MPNYYLGFYENSAKLLFRLLDIVVKLEFGLCKISVKLTFGLCKIVSN